MPSTVSQLLDLEWENLNALRAYPLADDAGETDTTGSFKIPRDLIIDLVWPIPFTAGTQPANFFLSKLVVFASGVVLTFSYWTGAIAIPIGTISIAAETHVKNTPYYIGGLSRLDQTVGLITIGTLDTTLQTPGSYTFTLENGRLIPTVFRPDLQGIAGVELVDAAGNKSELLHGKLQLRAGRNIRLTKFTTLDGFGIQIDAVSSVDLTADCGCSTDNKTGVPIRSINGIDPDDTGAFTLVAGTGIDIAAGDRPGVIKITDTLSKPCCGSPELKVVQDDLKQLNQDARAMLQLITRLETGMLQLDVLKTAVQATGLTGTQDAIDTPV